MFYIYRPSRVLPGQIAWVLEFWNWMKGMIAGNLDVWTQKTCKTRVNPRFFVDWWVGSSPFGGENTDFREVEQEADPEHGEAIMPSQNVGKPREFPRKAEFVAIWRLDLATWWCQQQSDADMAWPGISGRCRWAPLRQSHDAGEAAVFFCWCSFFQKSSIWPFHVVATNLYSLILPPTC